MDKLLAYVSKIQNSQLLKYERNEELNDSLLEWKIFTTELFELINSPASSNLNKNYIIHIRNLHPS